VVPLPDQPQHLPVHALDRVTTRSIAIVQVIERKMRGEFPAAGHGETSF